MEEEGIGEESHYDKTFVDGEQVGNDFVKVLKEVIAIRMKRRKQYKDSYVQMKAVGHYWHAFNKMKRLGLNMESSNLVFEGDKYESVTDNARDIINYLLFMLVMIEKERMEKVEV